VAAVEENSDRMLGRLLLRPSKRRRKAVHSQAEEAASAATQGEAANAVTEAGDSAAAATAVRAAN